MQHGVPNMSLVPAPLSLLCDNAQFDRHLQIESAEGCLTKISALGAIGLLAWFCDKIQRLDAAGIYKIRRERFSLWLTELTPVCKTACAQDLTTQRVDHCSVWHTHNLISRLYRSIVSQPKRPTPSPYQVFNVQ